MIIASDKGSHFEAKLTPIDGKWRARWTVMLGGISETDVRDFDTPADAWDWIDKEAVRRGWLALIDTFSRDGHTEIAAHVKRHVEQMPRPGTEKEYIAARMSVRRVREPRAREREFSR